MNQIFHISNRGICINSLVIQPTFECKHQCKRCYVQAHQHYKSNITAIDLGEIKEIIQIFLDPNSQYSTNQITISIDNVPENSLGYQFYSHLLDDLNPTLVQEKMCLSVRNTKDLVRYKYNQPFHMVSFSQLDWNDLNIIKELHNTGTHINWNLQANCMSDITQTLLHLDNYLDSLYLILHKEPLSEQNSNVQPLQYKLFQSNRRLYEQVFGNLRIKTRLIQDTCVEDGVKYRLNKQYCSANISKFTIWPDGSVSGCPYAIESDTPPATTAKDILQNIILSSKHRNFTHCRI